MYEIKNVAISGATGNLGPSVLNGLLASGKFKVTVLTRAEPSSKTSFPPEVTVIPVDYTSAASLEKALAGQDALVSTIASLSVPAQKLLFDAAISAGVKRLIPSEFGSNTLNTKANALPVFRYKIEVREYLEQKVKAGAAVTYSYIITGPFLDWALQVGLILGIKNKKPEIVNGGDVYFSATSLPSIGRAVAGVLEHPAETKNRAVYVRDLDVTQNKILALAKKYAGEDGWEVTHVNTDDLYVEAQQDLKEGGSEWPLKFMKTAIFGKGYESQFEKDDNELLGIKGWTEEDLEVLVKQVVTA